MNHRCLPPCLIHQERETDANSPQTSAGKAYLLNYLLHIFTIDSPSHLEAVLVEQLVAPGPDVEQPAAWCYDRSLFVEQTTKALRLAVLTSLQCDRQMRDEHAVPVLRANQAIPEPSLPSPTVCLLGCAVVPPVPVNLPFYGYT